MFHVNAWGLPYACPLVGARMVMPGPRLDGASLYQQIERERVTFAAGVPTVWFGLLDHLRETRQPTYRARAGRDRRCRATALHDRGVRGRVRRRGAARLGHDRDEPGRRGLQLEARSHDGAGPCRAASRSSRSRARPSGASSSRSSTIRAGGCPTTARAPGVLYVRGPWIASGYFRDEAAANEAFDEEGWFSTGDVATIDPHGYMQITDRAKDMVKSGGEWISSIALENAAVGHPALAEAAVIAVPHPKWGERPLLVAVRRPGAEVAPSRDPRVPRGQGRQMVAAGRRGVRRRAAAHGDRQDQEIGAARAVPGLRPADRLRAQRFPFFSPGAEAARKCRP